MALSVNELIYPNGELLPSMFPDEDIASTVGVWLFEANGYSDNIAAQRAWVYHRAYNAIANRIASTPNSESSFGTHSVGWGQDRIKAFRDLAADYLAEYTRLTGSPAVGGPRAAYFRVY